MPTDIEPRVSQRDVTRIRIAHVLFEALYHSRTLYWLASTIPFAGQWRVWQRLALDRVIGEDVLEVGCGIGTLLADMIERGYRCQAIDRSPQMVAATRRELRRRGLDDGAEIVRQGSVQALPFASASFDNVVSTFPTDYIADAQALSEIRRTLRPGGRLIVVLSAALLPTRALLGPLVAVQRLVYGQRAIEAQASAHPEIGAPLLERMRQAGFTPRLERVARPFWVAYVITATNTTNLLTD
ncbi:MAG TPA: class I SAM-dependent methyltransferase [Ktedonobacterales bacterium]|nr:class I SAM-dependent methyltransferase [Ktedonobacterales bacterium]